MNPHPSVKTSNAPGIGDERTSGRPRLGALAGLVLSCLPIQLSATQSEAHTTVEYCGNKVRLTSLVTGNSWYADAESFKQNFAGTDLAQAGFQVVGEDTKQNPPSPPAATTPTLLADQPSPAEADSRALPGAPDPSPSSAAEQQPQGPRRTTLASLMGIDWINKQIQRNLHGALQTGFTYPVSEIPGLSGRLSGRYELQRIGNEFRRQDTISFSGSFGQGLSPALLAINAAGTAVPVSLSASVSRTQAYTFMRQSKDYWGMALDGVYLPTAVPKNIDDIQAIDVGTMLSIPVSTSFGPGIGMEKVVPLFGKALGDQALVARAGASGGLYVSGTFDVHLFRRSEDQVGLIIQSRSQDGYSAGVDVRLGTYYLQELANGEYGFATKKVQKRLRFSPLSVTIAAGSRSSGAALYHEFSLSNREHRELFNLIWSQVQGVPFFGVAQDIRNAGGALIGQLHGGASGLAQKHADRLAYIGASGAETLVSSVSHAGSSFSRSAGTNLPALAKLDAHLLRRFSKFAIGGRPGTRDVYCAQAESQRGHGKEWLLGFGGEAEVLNRRIVRAHGDTPESATRNGITELAHELRLSANMTNNDDASRIMARCALAFGPVLYESVAAPVLRSLSTSVNQDGVVALEIQAGLNHRGLQALFTRLAGHIDLSPNDGELILTSLLRTELTKYLGALRQITLMQPDRNAADEFRHSETTVFDSLWGGGDGTQHCIKILARRLLDIRQNWHEATEARREEMMDELVALLSTDTVFKQVGVGLLASIAASEYRGDPTDLCTIRFWDRTQPDASKPQVDYDGGFYSSANRMNDAAQLIQAGSASAFELFQRWAPRAQPVYENTSPSFEVTAPMPSLGTTQQVPLNSPGHTAHDPEAQGAVPRPLVQGR
jgi:hypothetical protein